MTNTIAMGEKAVRFLVSSCPTYAVDDSGFVINLARNPPQRHVLKLDVKNTEEVGKEIVIYQDPIPEGDYFLLNPYAEGMGLRAPPLTFLYDALALTCAHRVGIVIDSLIAMLILSNKDGNKAIPESALRIVSKHQVDGKALVDLVDDKMSAEISTILDALGTHYIVPAYVPAQMTAKLIVKCLSDPDFETSFGKTVRKKTVKVFLALTKGILDIDGPEDLSAFDTKYDPEMRVPPKMHTFLSTLLKVYLRFNDALEEAVADPDARIDLGELSEVIEQIPLVFPLARGAVIPQGKKSSRAVDPKPLSRGTSARDDILGTRRDRDRDRDDDREPRSFRDSVLGIRSERERDRDYREGRRSRYDDDDDGEYNRFGQRIRSRDDDRRRDLDDDDHRRRGRRDRDRDRDDDRLERGRGGNYDSYRGRTTRYR